MERSGWTWFIELGLVESAGGPVGNENWANGQRNGIGCRGELLNTFIHIKIEFIK
jgi:hypothetical protein